MSIKQRLIKRHAAASKVATWKPMRRQAASERAELYKHEADMMIAEVEKAIGSGKILCVPVYNLYFTDDEQEAVNEFLYEEYPSVAAFVDNEIELAASNGDDEWIDAAQELGEKYANDAEGFCKAYMDFWEEHGYYGLIDMYITEGQLFEDWKKRVYEEAQSAAERHDTRAASRKRTLTKRSAATKRFAADNKAFLNKELSESDFGSEYPQDYVNKIVAIMDSLDANGWQRGNRGVVYKQVLDGFEYTLTLYTYNEATFTLVARGTLPSQVTGNDESVYCELGRFDLDEMNPVITLADDIVSKTMEKAKKDLAKTEEHHNYEATCDDLVKMDDDAVIEYIMNHVRPYSVINAALDVVLEHDDIDTENKILALFDFKYYDMYDDADVAKVKQMVAKDQDMTPEEADAYVEENLIDNEVLVLEKLSTHQIGTIALNNSGYWDLISGSCREATKDDADKVTRIMLSNASMRDNFIRAAVGKDYHD